MDGFSSYTRSGLELGSGSGLGLGLGLGLTPTLTLTPLDGRLLFLRQDCDASDKDEADLALLGEQKLRNVALLAP